MAVDLNVLCNFSVTIRGVTFTGKQGAGTDNILSPFVVSVDGDGHVVPFTMLNGATLTIWDDDDDKPADFDFLFVVADQNFFIQVIASATNFIVPQLAKVPFILAPKTDAATAKCLAAANTTIMSGTAPSVTEIDSVVIQNNSGSTMYGTFAVFD